MHVWECVFGLAVQVGDFCEPVYACVGVCVWAYTRRMLSVIAARRCMRVWECVSGLLQGACSV
jgi:hypothetical protein